MAAPRLTGQETYQATLLITCERGHRGTRREVEALEIGRHEIRKMDKHLTGRNIETRQRERKSCGALISCPGLPYLKRVCFVVSREKNASFSSGICAGARHP